MESKNHVSTDMESENQTATAEVTSSLPNSSLYVCEICKTFAAKFDMELVHHVRDSHGLFKCRFCKLVFQNREGLCQHIQSFHGKHSCRLCPKRFVFTATLERHMQKVHNIYANSASSIRKQPSWRKAVNCVFCKELFASLPKLYSHIATIHVTQKCKYCRSRYVTEKDKILHMLEKHAKMVFLCDLCEKLAEPEKQGLVVYHGVRDLNHHQATWHRISCVNCKQVYDDKDLLVRHIDYDHLGLRHFCNICKERGFSSRAHLLAHRKMHLPVYEEITCHECEKSFKRGVEFDMHSPCHNGSDRAKRNLVCSLCETQFKGSVSLSEHMSRHVTNTNFPCGDCDKTFVDKYSLKHHAKTHSEAKNLNSESTMAKVLGYHSGGEAYCCEECGKTFRTNKMFTRHILVHSNEHPYKCSVCVKAFKTPIGLSFHTKRHEQRRPYKCAECGKAYASRHHLRHHILTHSGERPHACQYCDKRFTQNAHLKIHLRSHTLETPYQCEKCGMKFRYSPDLLRHRRKNDCKEKK